MDRSTTQLVKAFNDLPRIESISLERWSNDWYFDVRYIQLEPNPFHALYIMQHHAPVRHIEPLPAGLPVGQDGLVYFPETGRDAAPEVGKAILYAFLNNMGHSGPYGPLPYAPRKLFTPDKVLLRAVNEEFRRIGVHSSLEVAESAFLVTCVADDSFDLQYASLKKKMEYTGSASANLIIPDSICFPDVAEAIPPLVTGKAHWDVCMAYVRHLMQARPIDEILDSATVITKMTQEVKMLQEKIKNLPEPVVRVQADSGDHEAALDYGMRLRFGLGCTLNRQLSRAYLIKALNSPLSSDVFKATVHAALIEWYVDARKDGVLKNRFLCAAAHHAKAAVLLSRRADPQRKYYCNHILAFSRTLIEVNEKANTMGQIHLLYNDVVQISKKRDEHLQEEQKKMAQKRLKTPHRYRCAAAGCGIQSDTGRMLSRCSGECNVDKKPSYCSKECQKADWKNHKPFCRPGAECSVIDDGVIGPPLQGGYTSNDGTIQIPVTYADGSTMYFSSSTLEPKVLKEMAESLSTRAAPGGSGVPKTWKVDMVDAELNVTSF